MEAADSGRAETRRSTRSSRRRQQGRRASAGWGARGVRSREHLLKMPRDPVLDLRAIDVASGQARQRCHAAICDAVRVDPVEVLTIRVYVERQTLACYP